MISRTWEMDDGNEFDIVIVPRGTVDPKVVVGTIGANDVATVKSGRVRSAKLVWGGRGADRLFGSLLEITIPAPPPPANDSLEAQAEDLLGQLAETLDTLAIAQNAFRADLRSAIAEGDAMLSKAAG